MTRGLQARSEAILERIENGHMPALELSRDLENALDRLQRDLQDAVAAEDAAAVEAVSAARDSFLARAAQGHGNPVLSEAVLSGLTDDFRAYFALAQGTSARLARGESGEDLSRALGDMTGRYSALRDRLSKPVVGRIRCSRIGGSLGKRHRAASHSTHEMQPRGPDSITCPSSPLS